MDSRGRNGERTKLWPNLGPGLGLRHPHYAHVVSSSDVRVRWFEATPENFMGISTGGGGRPLRVLEKVRENFPVVLHGVSLSIGSTDPLDLDYLKRLRALADRIQPEWLSDHLCWTGVGGANLHDLLPLPYTEETVAHVSARILKVQEILGRRMIFENVSSYLSYAHSEMTEWEFVAEIARRADCGLLVDVNNIYVSAINHDVDPLKYLDGLPSERVGQIHLAGHTEHEGLLIDTHDQPVPEAVWELYAEATKRFGAVSTMIERDANIPDFASIEAEALRAEAIQAEELGIDRRHPESRAETGAHV